MSIQATVRGGVSSQGIGMDDSQTLESDMGIEPVDATLAAGTAASAWTDVDADSGVATLESGHELTSGLYDVYWEGGFRYGTTGTVDGDTLTLEGGDGDDLPDTDTPVIVSKQVSISSEFDGSDLVMIAAKSTQRTALVFLDESSAVLLVVELLASKMQRWHEGIGFGLANPLAGNSVASITASCGTATAAGLKIVGQQNGIE